MYSMNKFVLFMRKTFVTFILIFTMASLSLFSGCFSLGGGDDGEIGVDDLLYGVRVTYQRQGYDDDHNIVPVADKNFVKDLMTQYLNISVEVLVSLVGCYGKGVDDLDKVLQDIPNDYGDVTITDVLYAKELSSSEPNYCIMVDDSGKWDWAEGLKKSDSANKLAASFCNSSNLFKMQVALYLINIGNTDCAEVNGDTLEDFNTETKEKIEALANDIRVTHSGLIEKEQEVFTEFVLNNVVGSTHRTYCEEDVKQMLKEIFAQKSGRGKNGEDGLKYPVVASLTIKDYSIRDIAVDRDDSGDENAEDVDDEKDATDDSNEFFSMEIGQQYYKSMVFMPKTSFKFNGLSLIFESTEDLTLKIRLRLHEKDSEDLLIDEEVAEIHIYPGSYDDLDDDKAAEFNLEIKEILEEKIGTPVDYYVIDKYEQDTDVTCYSGLFGTGIGDGLLDVYGKALTISNKEDDITLASLYKITKESENSVAVTTFEKMDSSYIELIFETVGNKPFNIGYLEFDYED